MNRKYHIAGIFLLILILNGCISNNRFYSEFKYNAGYTIRYFTYTTSLGEIKDRTIYIWYPSDDQPSNYNYLNMSGLVAFNGSVADDKPFPVVVFSHGYKGNGLQSLFITQKLAEEGYVVVSINHDDATFNWSNISITKNMLWNDSFFIDRRDDIKVLIDILVELNDSDPILKGFIDTTRIAGMGHSLGGYTILGLTGCWNNWRDDRIKLALLYSPFVQPFENLDGIETPIMIQGGTLDRDITPYIEEIYDKLSPPKYFLILRGATHGVWTNLACIWRNYTSIEECYDKCVNVKLIISYSTAFLDYYFKDDIDALKYLHNRNPYLDSYKYDDA